MKHMTQFGYFPSDIISDEELSDFLQFCQENDIDIQEGSNVDILIAFSDYDLLEIVNTISASPPVLVVETKSNISFFAQCRLDQTDLIRELLLNHSFEKQNRMMLEIIMDETKYIALNDVYITSSYPNTRMRFDILIDDRSVNDEYDSANGILVSTATGSTAMAFNLGGAIIHPGSEVFQLLTVASRNMFKRHQIISSSSQLKIEILDTQYPLFIQIDARKFELSHPQITIERADAMFPMVVASFSSDYSSLSQKLTRKLSFEDTRDLTSSAKFILHVLQKQSKGMTVKQIMDITHLHNQKTIRNSLQLLISKGFVVKRDNLEDMREHIYSFVNL